MGNHIKIFGGKINIPKLIRACEKYQQYDNAVTTMIQHTPEAFEHPVFKDIITKVANTEILYKAIKFYIDTHPTEINDLMATITPRVDHVRVTKLVQKEGHLPMIKE